MVQELHQTKTKQTKNQNHFQIYINIILSINRTYKYIFHIKSKNVNLTKSNREQNINLV